MLHPVLTVFITNFITIAENGRLASTGNTLNLVEKLEMGRGSFIFRNVVYCSSYHKDLVGRE